MSNDNTTVETPSGLIVPASAVVAPARKRRAMPVAKVKRMQRFLVEMHEEGVTFLMACIHCKTPIQAGSVDKILNGAPGGRLVLRCKCSDRVAV